MKSIILLFLCLRISFVHATPAPFLPAGFKSWFWPSSIVVDNWLYLHGGEIHYEENGNMTLQPNSKTYGIDLTKSWTTSTVNATTSGHDEAFKPSRRPEVFYDALHNVVYSYGGAYYGPHAADYGNPILYEANVKPEVWGFTPPENGYVNWSLQYAKSISDSFPLNSSVEYALTVSSDKKHYSLGGSVTYDVGANGVPEQMVMEGLVTYDYATQKFDNVTQPPPYRLMGEAHFLPNYGVEGVLLFFGGRDPVDRSVKSLNIAALDTVQVYDIHTDTFHIQTTTGVSPEGRFTSCSVGVSNAQNSSYEIFMYGGDENSADAAAPLSKVFILTLPAFHWLEVPTPASTWRNNHKCQKIGQKSISEYNQRQMLSVGGDMHPGSGGWKSYVDPWTSSMKIFDLTTLIWSDSYNHDAKAYARPDIVDQVYLSNLAFPSIWGDAELHTIFNNSATATTPNTTPTPTPNPEKEAESKTNVGAIAGGVVGGVAVAALAGFLLWWFCWRYRKANNEGGELAATDYQGYQGYHNVKQVSDDGAVRERTELSVGEDMPRRELPVGEDMPRRELEANEYQPNYKTQEPQELPTSER